MTRIQFDSEYQRRLDAWARQLATNQGWTPPADAVAVWQYDPGWEGTDVTDGEDAAMALKIGHRTVAVYTLDDLPRILEGIVSVKL